LHVPTSFKLSPKIPRLFRTFSKNAFDIAFCFWPFTLPALPPPLCLPICSLFVHILYRFGLLPLKTLHAHFLLFSLRVRCVFTFKSENTDSSLLSSPLLSFLSLSLSPTHALSLSVYTSLTSALHTYKRKIYSYTQYNVYAVLAVELPYHRPLYCICRLTHTHTDLPVGFLFLRDYN